MAREELAQRMDWFIRLRWLAVIGVVCAATAGRYLFHVLDSAVPHYLLAAGLALCNVGYWLYARHLWAHGGEEAWMRAHTRFAEVQITLDLLILSLLIHFSGGIENPFLLYYIFHMVIASILLSQWESYIFATLAAVLVGAMAVLEATEQIQHYHLRGFVSEEMCQQPLFVMGVWVAFASTLYLTVYMAGSIARRLREREQEVIDARDALAESNRLLRELDKAKSRYVLMVTHELRSPLAAVRSLLQVLTSGYAGECSPKQKEMLERVSRRAGELQDLVSDLLELSRIRASIDSLPDERVRLDDLAAQVCAMLETVAQQKQIHVELHADAPAEVRGDESQLRLLISNLLSNALKYTPDGGRVSVSVRRIGEEIELEVSDTGIGIPQEDLPHLFEEFFRARNVRRESHSGTGLGLSIVKEIATRHHGQVSVESEVGKGSRFRVKIPSAASLDAAST